MKHLISLKTNQGIASVEDYQNGRIDRGDVIGVILQTEVIGVIISLDQWNEIWCNERKRKVFNKACSEAEALQTLSGLELTRNIVKKNKEDGEDMTAAMRCWQYKKGNLQWYLPSLYELGTIIAYCDELNEVLEMLDADQFDKDYWGWSSSEANSESTWYIYFGSGNFYNGLKSSIYVVRAVSAFSPLQREKSMFTHNEEITAFMEIKIENAKAALKAADKSVKKVLLALLPELKETEAQTAANRPIIERVKTFEDACRELGEDNHFVEQYHVIVDNGNFTSDGHDFIAYLKLRIIAAALNEGWKPQFTEDEERWYPWFTLWTEEELSEKSDEWKADRHLISTGDYSRDYAGFSYSLSYTAPSDTYTYAVSRLCFKSEALATYCGKQFISLWADFNMIKK